METREQEKKERAKKKAVKLKNDFTAGVRPGVTSVSAQNKRSENLNEFDPLFKITLGDIEKLSVNILEPNPLNTYPALSSEQMKELVGDMKDKGVLVPLIAMTDGVLLCGHNRLKAAKEAGIRRVPVQTVLKPLKISDELQLEIMRSENDKRRGGNWSKQEKKDWILKFFKDELLSDNRGGDQKSAKSKIKSDASLLILLEHQINQKSRGDISESVAKKLLAELRKELKGRQVTRKKNQPKQESKRQKLLARLEKLSEKIDSMQKKLKESKDQKRKIEKEISNL